VDAADVLGTVSIFAGLNRRELTQLAREAHDMSFPAGTKLTEESALGASFFVVAEGTAAVNVAGAAVHTLRPGDFFGEMALIDRETRSATVVAETDISCLVFSAWVFRPFALAHPEVAWALLETMVKRVREAEGRAAT
jgi:CRP/FNR family cyclic AMP-dependent transcriptional regulator